MMSFADELRKAPEAAQRRVEEKREKAWNDFAKRWYDIIKQRCRYAAEQGSTSSYFKFCTYAETVDEDAELYQRITCRLNPRHEYITFCLSLEDADDLAAKIEKWAKCDGLTVNVRKKEHQKYRLKSVYVERSNKERVAASILNSLFPSNQLNLSEDEGEYKFKKVEDGYKYSLEISVSW